MVLPPPLPTAKISVPPAAARRNMGSVPHPEEAAMAAQPLRGVLRHLRDAVLPPAAEPASDRDLLARFLAHRDQEAFTALVRRHERLVLAACRRVLSDPADVEDAFQATFLVLLRQARRRPWRASLGSWLYGVAHRVAVHARAARRRAERRAPAL